MDKYSTDFALWTRTDAEDARIEQLEVSAQKAMRAEPEPLPDGFVRAGSIVIGKESPVIKVSI